MPVTRLIQLCPSFFPYWVPIFDAISSHEGTNYILVTQSSQSSHNAKITLEMGKFRRKIVAGTRIPLTDGQANKGLGTPMGLNFAPLLPLHLMRLRPQVVIASNFGLWTLVPLIMGYPTVLFWEGTNHTERTVQPWRRKIRLWMARRAKAFVVNGKSAKQYLMSSLEVAEGRIFMGGLCAEPPPAEKCFLRPRHTQNGESVRFVFAGQLIKRKGVEQLLQAAVELSTRSLDRAFEIVVVGDGVERQNLETFCTRNKISQLVNFVGNIPPDDVWHYYAHADVFVLPTLQDNWPLVVPEAMSTGLPVLLSNLAGSVPDLIQEGVNGFSFDPSNPSKLADLMQIYIADPNLVEIHGAQSQTIVSAYTPDRAAKVFLSAANHALNTSMPS